MKSFSCMSAAILEEACLLKHKKKHKTLLYISQHAMLHSVVDMNPESIACIYEILLQCFYTTTSEFKCVVHKNHYIIIGFFFLCCLKLIYHGPYLTKHIYIAAIINISIVSLFHGKSITQCLSLYTCLNIQFIASNVTSVTLYTCFT